MNKLLAGSLLSLLLTGCSSRLPEFMGDESAASCQRFFQALDEVADGAGVADASTTRIAGFPHLRLNRFLASFAADQPQGEAYRFWLESMRRVDAETRQIELGRLSSQDRQRLQAESVEEIPPDRVIAACGKELLKRDIASPERRRLLLERAAVPDAYRLWYRAIGLYPLVKIAFAEGVSRLHRELRLSFALPLEKMPLAGQGLRYAPPAADVLSPERVSQLLQHSSRNALAIPEPSPTDLERLFQTYAPVWEIDTVDDDDRIGVIRMQNPAKARVDVTEPAVYRLISHARFHDRVLLQLNYLIWFPARPSQKLFDLLAGRFDGLIWRVTLSSTGKPIAYDSIHPCGCYYQIFPAEGFRVVQPEDGTEPVLSPQPLATVKSGLRLVIRLAHGSHYIQQVYADRAGKDAVGYGWRDYDELRSLPMPDGRRVSFFDRDGLVPGSERDERFLYWPMGIPSAGAMRQWGVHAIAFLGIRHFDDPRLLESLLRPLDSVKQTD